MQTKGYKGTFKFDSPINSETSFGITPISDKTESKIEVSINLNGYGWFEWVVKEFDLVESGGLWFDGNELTDYDGVFELPSQLIKHLESQGYNMDYAKV